MYMYFLIITCIYGRMIHVHVFLDNYMYDTVHVGYYRVHIRNVQICQEKGEKLCK